VKKKESVRQIERRIAKELAMPCVQDRLYYERWRAAHDPRSPSDDFIWGNIRDSKPK
jgi:hypothetical protein